MEIFAQNPEVFRRLAGDGDLRTLKTELLDMCRVHFQLANLFKTEAIDIGWLCCYFLGKVGEKQGRSVADIVDDYVECLRRMADDKYVVLAKVSKKSQAHFEPLELFYRINAFLHKRFKALRTDRR